MASEIRPGSFQVLPTIIKNLIIINGLVWLAQITIGQQVFPMEDRLALHYFRSPLYEPWQFLTYMFLHDPGSPFHILFNMFALWMFGSTLENLWGAKRFLLFYLVCGFGAGLVQMAANAYDLSRMNVFEYHAYLNIPTLGASGAVMGIFAAFAYTFPNSQLLILPIPFPIKAKWALLGMVALDLFGGISSQQSGIAHFAHIGGALVGIVLVMLWNKKNRRTFY